MKLRIKGLHLNKSVIKTAIAVLRGDAVIYNATCKVIAIHSKTRNLHIGNHATMVVDSGDEIEINPYEEAE